MRVQWRKHKSFWQLHNVFLSEGNSPEYRLAIYHTHPPSIVFREFLEMQQNFDAFGSVKIHLWPVTPDHSKTLGEPDLIAANRLRASDILDRVSASQSQGTSRTDNHSCQLKKKMESSMNSTKCKLQRVSTWADTRTKKLNINCEHENTLTLKHYFQRNSGSTWRRYVQIRSVNY